MTALPGRGRRPSPAARLAAAGLPVDRARTLLADAGLWGPDGPAEGVLDVLAGLSEAADPEACLLALTVLVQEQPDALDALRADDWWRRRFVAVAGASRPLGELLARHADALAVLRAPRPVSAREIAQEVRRVLAADGRAEDLAAGIATVRRRATAAIAARDLTGEATVDEVAVELSALAEGVLDGTLAALHAAVAGDDRAARLAVVGMGKLGGEELNYVSDVDVMFVHEPAGSAGEEEARDEARRVFEELLRLLNASTTMGRVYEIDPTLRPEGRAGPLSRTVDSFVAYWDRWAKTWEFQALLKARPVAGDRELAASLLQRSAPYVFPEHLDAEAVAEVRAMKSRVESKPEVVRHGKRQVKLGPGGLRDIEFAVQLLQLVHGRADRSLRHTGTLAALDALARGGYVADTDAEAFAESYRFLRTVEHRLQLAHERRSHTIPSDPDGQERLARSLGYRAEGQQPARAEFLVRLKSVQADARELHAKLFYRPLLEIHAEIPAGDAGLARPDTARAMGEEAALRRLEVLGFSDARAAVRHLGALTGGVSRRARILQAVLPAMLHVLAASPDPDVGLRILRSLVEAHGPDSSLLANLRDHPPAAELLARVVGTSEVAGELLTAQPAATDWLIDPSLRESPRNRDDLVHAAMAQLGWHDDLEGRATGLRRFKRRELLRLVLRDIAGAAPVSVVGHELTALAEACLQAGLEAIIQDMGGEAPARLAVVGMGKLGGRELHYPSDLDVLFVHEPAPGVDEADASRFATEVAGHMLSVLGAVTAGGTAFEIDADLRPEGRSGPLSRSLSSYESYYGRWSEVWEHQALLKARAVGGDPDLGHAFVERATPLAYPPDLDKGEATAMRKMKARIERERIPRRVAPKQHLKLGPGGLSDVEWTVQYLQRRHGHGHAVVRTASTMGGLDALQDDGLLETRDATWLRDGYRFLSRIRNRLYLLRQRSVDVLPTDPRLVERLARSLDYGRGGRQEFEADYLRHTRRVRQVTERVFYGT